MNMQQWKVMLKALIWSGLLLLFLTVSLTKSISANESLTLYYTIDRSALPDLSYKELTLKVYAGDATNAEISTISGTPISYTASSDYLIFTTAANQVQVVLDGVTDTNNVGQVTKTALKDNKKWAWSLGLDDNTFIKQSIDVLDAKGWAGTLFMIANTIHDTRNEGWIVDAPYLKNKVTEGWAIGNHSSAHQCSGQIDYHQAILDGYNRLQGIILQSANPTYKLISFAAPCFNANYHPQILAMRDNGETAVQFNESGNRYLLIVDAAQTTDFVTPERTAVSFDVDMPIGRDPHIAYDTADVIAKIDWMAANASDNHHFWYNNLAHGHAQNTIGQVVEYLYQTYGPAGTDEAWVAPSDMIYSYLLVRDNSIVTVTGDLPVGNQPPAIINPGNQQSNEETTISLALTASDADDDGLLFSATGLPTALTIEASTGLISGTLLSGSAGSYNVVVTVTDDFGDSDSVSFTWTVNAAPVPEDQTGKLLLERWNGVFGKTIDSLTSDPDYPYNPTTEGYLSTFELPENTGTAYGTRVRGYIHPPITGDYSFWIAADNSGELWLSSDDSAAHISLIASVPDWTDSQQWDKYQSQESVLITLQAGERYYIQTLHKQEWSNDHLAVAWQIPGGSLQVIEQQYLSLPDVTEPTNLAPSITNPGNQTNLTTNNISLSIIANDPEGDSLTYSATELPTGLLINSTTGVITGTIAEDADINSPYNATIIVTDSHTNTASTSFTWTVNALPTAGGTGQILHERWNGIFGKTINSLTSDPDYPNNPDVETYLTRFEIPQNVGDIYGTRVRGYIHPPVTGDYRFWIASDNAGELWLSTDESPANISLIASAPDWTNPQQWDKYESQTSILIPLEAGERYYIEARHKEEWNNDHLAVAWQIPGDTQQIIAGEYLSIPDPAPTTNQPPAIINPGEQTNLIGDEITLAILANDPEGDSLTYSTDNLPGGLSVNSNTGLITGIIAQDTDINSPYAITITVTDSHTNTNSVTFTWTINPVPTGEETGHILHERWNGIFGKTIDRLTSDPDYPNNPDIEAYLTSFELPQNTGDIYGTRIRGYINPPVTGEYRFWLASDNAGQLWLSTDDNPTNINLIASVADWTASQQWDKYPSQKSSLITLQADERYYIQALHKEEWGGDHLAVAWEIPAGSREVIQGQYLSLPDPAPATNQAPAISNPGAQTNFTSDEVSLAIIANDPEGDNLTYSASNLPAGLTVNTLTGQIAGTIAENAHTTSPYTINITVTDDHTNSSSINFTWTINALPTGDDVGYILREQWNGIFGKTVDRLTSVPTYPDSPNIEDYLTSFELPSNTGDIFGTRVRGYLHAPVTGEYRFWLASDNGGELWLSGDDDANNKSLIASVPDWTSVRQWDKYQSQQSILITLQAGERYYIEALHKEEWGGDHLAVAWQIPGSTRAVIAGSYLSP